MSEVHDSETSICSLAVAYVSGYEREPMPMRTSPQMLDATPERVFVTQWTKKRPFKMRERETLFSFPLSEVKEIQIESISDARSEYGWELLTGFLHGPKRIAAMTGVVFVLTGGENVLFRVGGAPIEVRTRMAPLLKRMDAGR